MSARRMARTLALLLFLSDFAFAQRSFLASKDSIISNLSALINSKRDSIKQVKLHTIITTHHFAKGSFVSNQTYYDTKGNLVFDEMIDGVFELSCHFEYDSLNNLTSIDYFRKSDHGGGREKTYLDGDIDTAYLYDRLQWFSPVLLLRSRQKELAEDKKKEKETGNYRSHKDTIKIGDSEVITSKSFLNKDFFYSILDIIDTDNSNMPNVSAKYNYSMTNRPIGIEYIRYDTLNKIKKTYHYFPSFFKNDVYLLKNYQLYSIVTETQHLGFYESVEELYNDYLEKIFKKVKFIETNKIYPNYKEHKEYKITLFHRKKLIWSSSEKTEYSYFD